MENKNSLGKKVQLFREMRNLSIEEVSKRSGLCVDEIQKIENGDLIPSLTPLIKIARVLGTRLGSFLDDDENLGPVVTRKETHTSITRFSNRDGAVSSDLDFFSLAQNKTSRHMEPFLIDIHPLSEKEYRMSSHEGEECIYVLSGSIEVKYGSETHVLNEGDSIYYDSIVEHHVHSASGEAARILAVIYTPA
ncbi:MAG TPA: XRE family transcriptional regulator [Treponemataceae bacterium]|jgi:transcriptional regulator with XRE-family HTH domain|nr:XRE family transcriptional regulator [Treponemataceae bacterium]